MNEAGFHFLLIVGSCIFGMLAGGFLVYDWHLGEVKRMKRVHRAQVDQLVQQLGAKK